MKLSILIATVPPRKSQLSRLLHILEPQLTDEVEVLVYDGWVPFGDKVNDMRHRAHGDFSIVIDDDDHVAEYYIQTILPHLTDDIDYLSYGIEYLVDGKREFDIYKNEPHHKCPVRNAIAKGIPLGNKYHDDNKWSNEAHLQLKRRIELHDVLYTYDFSADSSVGTEPSDTTAIQPNVGVFPYDARNFTWY